MHVLLVGNGGREHALAWRIARSPSLSSLTVTGPNPGWPHQAVLRLASGNEAIVRLAQYVQADLVVVGPEAPLADGLADALAVAGIPCFGASRAAARLETSKAFAKEIMAAAGVPTAGFLAVDVRDPDGLEAARQRCAQGSVVLKADGLAAGKGVIVCATADEALDALTTMTSGVFGSAADRLVLEDLMDGPEVSVFGLTDGERVVPLPSAQDHKRIFDGDRGPNTGGMGAYAPCPLVSAADAEGILDAVHRPVVREMARRGTPYRGVLYAGLMMTKDGPRVLEFNARFGDPECQPLMVLWDDDVLPWLLGAAKGQLPEGAPKFANAVACCVVVASAGYPATATKGVPIPEPPPSKDVVVFFAGAQRDSDGVLKTSGGRVLGVTAVGPDLETARAKAYAAVAGWTFEGAQWRTDIGKGGLKPTT